MAVFDPKRPFLTHFRPKMTQTRFFQGKFFWPFLKDQKISSYGKNKQDAINGFGEIGQKWPKTHFVTTSNVLLTKKGLLTSCPGQRGHFIAMRAFHYNEGIPLQINFRHKKRQFLKILFMAKIG